MCSEECGAAARVSLNAEVLVVRKSAPTAGTV